ncbi:hypothetical protein NP493_1358g02026 [Ridgeia piscesae]|uniref:Protein kinase domain-containing protein n=1 Tax=Ridgeia piscesae TaxID=27915 RepID=A0AAD9NEG4_RIDPI|nr:hypothetical protein NP493_1358g02026 [Ridgeia piscesae]
MAPEQLNLAPGEVRTYDKTTDIWSYAVTLWEIFSKGADPYSDQDKTTLKTLLESGYRMPRPVECEEPMYDEVMEPCWNTHAAVRPSFADVIEKIEILFIGGAVGDDYDYDVTSDSHYVGLVNASTPGKESMVDNPMYTDLSDVNINVNQNP